MYTLSTLAPLPMRIYVRAHHTETSLMHIFSQGANQHRKRRRINKEHGAKFKIPKRDEVSGPVVKLLNREEGFLLFVEFF